MAFTWLKAPNSALTFKKLSKHDAERDAETLLQAQNMCGHVQLEMKI